MSNFLEQIENPYPDKVGFLKQREVFEEGVLAGARALANRINEKCDHYPPHVIKSEGEIITLTLKEWQVIQADLKSQEELDREEEEAHQDLMGQDRSYDIGNLFEDPEPYRFYDTEGGQG